MPPLGPKKSMCSYPSRILIIFCTFWTFFRKNDFVSPKGTRPSTKMSSFVSACQTLEYSNDRLFVKKMHFSTFFAKKVKMICEGYEHLFHLLSSFCNILSLWKTTNKIEQTKNTKTAIFWRQTTEFLERYTTARTHYC